MIIVVRCFTCGKVLADKWEYYQEACKELDASSASSPERRSGGGDDDQNPNPNQSSRGKILDRLQLDRICCRRHFLGHVDLMDVI
jgi:DNA-directed RNA polymerase subunit N (RpoN/RPB10)